MRKTITAIVATAGIAAAALGVPKPAEARCIGCWVGAGVAAAVIGGAVASQAYGGYGYGYPPTVTATDIRPTATAILRTGMLPTPTHPVTMRMRRDVPMRVATIATEALYASRRPDVGRFSRLADGRPAIGALRPPWQCILRKLRYQSGRPRKRLPGRLPSGIAGERPCRKTRRCWSSARRRHRPPLVARQQDEDIPPPRQP